MTAADLEAARAAILLSEGRIVPPVGSEVDVYQHMYGELVRVASGGTIQARMHDGSDGTVLAIRYDLMVEDFWLLPDDTSAPRFVVLPTRLPDDCPPLERWPSWRPGEP